MRLNPVALMGLILLVILTTFLGPLVTAGAFSAITKDVKLFYAMVFLIQFAMPLPQQPVHSSLSWVCVGWSGSSTDASAHR